LVPRLALSGSSLRVVAIGKASVRTRIFKVS
jgi:hypothetical protein